MEKEFVDFVWDRNTQFISDLTEQSDGTRFDFESDGKICWIRDDGSYTGIDLLNIFAKMVQSTYFERRIMHQLVINDSALIKIIPDPTRKQPGNAKIFPCETYHRYESYFGVDMIKFSPYFARFLRKPLSQMHSEPSSGSRKWEWALSILLLFEITRRIPESDTAKYSGLPIAAVILIAVEYKIPWFCDAFRDDQQGHPTETSRKAVCEEIVSRFFKEFDSAAKAWNGKSKTFDYTILNTAKEQFTKLMKMYDERKAQIQSQQRQQQLLQQTQAHLYSAQQTVANQAWQINNLQNQLQQLQNPLQQTQAQQFPQAQSVWPPQMPPNYMPPQQTGPPMSAPAMYSQPMSCSNRYR